MEWIASETRGKFRCFTACRQTNRRLLEGFGNKYSYCSFFMLMARARALAAKIKGTKSACGSQM